jgi:type IX secretion system PorP/SprF family membrane protein
MGLSVQNLFESPVFQLQDDMQTVEGLERGNYFLTGGMSFDLSRFNNIEFLPSVLVKYTPTLPVSIDINANFRFNNIFEAGVSYRQQNSISAMASIIVYKNYRIGYAYENYFTSIGQNLSSHEIILRLDLNFKRNKRWLFQDCCYF